MKIAQVGLGPCFVIQAGPGEPTYFLDAANNEVFKAEKYPGQSGVDIMLLDTDTPMSIEGRLNTVNPQSKIQFDALVRATRSLNDSNEWTPEARRGATEVILVTTPWTFIPEPEALYEYIWGAA